MMNRKQFLRSLAGLGVGALAVGCSNSDGSPEPVDAPPAMPDAPMMNPEAGMTTCASTTTTIGTNHGHVGMVPAADVMAGVQKTYNIQGASGHPHTVTITAAMFTMLKAGTSVMATSSNDAGHTHAVTVMCA